MRIDREPRIVCFTKGRPMQFRAFLESLQYYVGVDQDQIYIIQDKEDPEYKDIESDFNWAHWKYEIDYGSFDSALKDLFLGHHAPIQSDHTVLFCVDDLVWFKPFNLNLLERLWDHDDALGFTLRLGIKTKYFYNIPIAKCPDPTIFKPLWRHMPSHWGYPFELSCSAYRGSLVKEILEKNPNKFRLPNDLESFGVQYCMQNKQDQPNWLMMNSSAYASCADINRTQDIYQNPINGDPQNHSTENLLKLYKEGYRIDWKNYYGIEPEDCFLGQSHLRIVK